MSLADAINIRQQGGNRLDLLTFDLGGRQQFAINVLKVQEILPCPRLIQLPNAHPSVRGVAHLRGQSLSIIDLSAAIGGPPIPIDGPQRGSVLVSQISRASQGFLIGKVDRISSMAWKDVMLPPRTVGRHAYCTGVVLMDGKMIEVLDVERILGEVIGSEPGLVKVDPGQLAGLFEKQTVLVIDDSSVARNQSARLLEQLGLEYVLARDGREGIEALERLVADEERHINLVISDIEMPEMDGYSVTREIRKRPEWSHIHVLLHTSLTGTINIEHAKQAGADSILTKFVPDELVRAIAKALAGVEISDDEPTTV